MHRWPGTFFATLASLGCGAFAVAVAVGCSAANDDGNASGDDDSADKPDDDDESATRVDAGDGGGPECHPKSAEGFLGGLYSPPTGAYQGRCSAFQIAKYVDCRTGNKEACNDLADDTTDGGETCLDCIESREDDLAWGPIVLGDHAFEESKNESGCAALLVKDTTKTGCGQTIANYSECLHYVCDEACSGAAYFGCADEARTTECEVFTTAAKTKCKSADVSPCFAQPGDGPYDLVTRVMSLFCGAPL